MKVSVTPDALYQIRPAPVNDSALAVANFRQTQ
jgi:hypothetical protein